MHLIDWIIIGVLALGVGLAIWAICRRKRRGGCSCGCGSCSNSACKAAGAPRADESDS